MYVATHTWRAPTFSREPTPSSITDWAWDAIAKHSSLASLFPSNSWSTLFSAWLPVWAWFCLYCSVWEERVWTQAFNSVSFSCLKTELALAPMDVYVSKVVNSRQINNWKKVLTLFKVFLSSSCCLVRALNTIEDRSVITDWCSC